MESQLTTIDQLSPTAQELVQFGIVWYGTTTIGSLALAALAAVIAVLIYRRVRGSYDEGVVLIPIVFSVLFFFVGVISLHAWLLALYAPQAYVLSNMNEMRILTP